MEREEPTYCPDPLNAHLTKSPRGIPQTTPQFASVFKLPWGMRKHSLVGTWVQFIGWPECIRPVVTNGLHCHCSSIVLIVTQNQTHTRRRRLIGCTLECFHPPLHMTERWNRKVLVSDSQFTVPTHIRGFNDKRTVNIWQFGTWLQRTLLSSCWLSERARGNSLYGNVCVVFAEPVFTEGIMWERYAVGD